MMMKVLDTFAGAGGFSLGFDMAEGYEICGAIEKDAWACETFKANHPSSIVVQKEIDTYSSKDIVETFGHVAPDIILGGPPCQGFSIANRSSGDPKDPRNSLFREFVRVGDLFKPAVMIMENVPNLLKAKTKDKRFVLDIILEELESIGYTVNHKILQATDYGVPQIRKRLFVTASLIPDLNLFPKATHTVNDQIELFSSNLLSCPNLWDAISDLPEINAREGEPEMEYTKDPINDYQILMRKRSDKVYNHTAMKHSNRLVERFTAMKCGDSSSDVPLHLRPHKRNGKGEISSKVYDQNNRRMHPDRPCHTVPASFYANFVHPFKHRNFTPREGARIQSFPDNYRFYGKPTVPSKKLLLREGRNADAHLGQYNQIGNAVPPLLAKAFATQIRSELNQYKCLSTEII